jgi:hypothetical protein
MLRVRISRRRPRGVPGVTSFEVLVGGYISIEFDVLIPSSCFVFLLHAAMTSMWFSYALGYLPLLVSVGGTCMHECTDIVAERQQDDFKFSLLCSHLHLSTILDLFLSIHLFSGNCHLFAVWIVLPLLARCHGILFTPVKPLGVYAHTAQYRRKRIFQRGQSSKWLL